MASPEDVLDPERLAELRDVIADGSPALLADFVESYLDDLAQQLGQLRQAVASGNGALVRRIGHTLKSSSLTMAAAELAERFAAIEHLPDDEIGAGAVDLPALSAAADRTRDALLSLL